MNTPNERRGSSAPVYHASYLRFIERGRTNYLRLVGADQGARFEKTGKEAPGFTFVVRSMQIKFRKAARMDDVLEVTTSTHEVRGASITLDQRVMRRKEVLVEARVQAAFVSGGRARRIPEALRAAKAREPAVAPPYRRLAPYNVNTLHMSWSKHDGGRGGSRGYHHGNLKEALMRAALELIAKKGPGGFTFAEAARWAGVSPAAPYRHFRDRDELLASVALRGFQQFEAALTRAWDDGRPDPFAAFDRLGKAYLAFARSEPAYYSAMFEAGIPLDTSPELVQAGDEAFGVLRRATDALIATMPASQRPPVGMMALHVWSLSHGIASLFARGDAGRRRLPMSAEELLEAGVLVYLRGLGVTE